MFINFIFIVFIIFSIFLFIFLKKYNEIIQNFFSDSILIFIVVFLVVGIIAFPNESIQSAKNGLDMWFTIVIPALLPFFIGSELLMRLGVVSFVGTLLEPVMRYVFNVPGEGAFVFTMSTTSGYPVGVKIVAKLRKNKQISQIEAQRIISFCSTSGPLFLIGVVSIGLYNSSEVGLLIIISHYLAALLVGLLFRFYKASAVDNSFTCNIPIKKENVFKKAFKQLKNKNKKNPPFAILFSNAVEDSVYSILMVGGFIIVFSVIINILHITYFIEILSKILIFLLKPLNINIEIIKAIISASLGITIGSKLIADLPNVDFINRIALTSFIIAWSGFSIHAQSISILSATDINLNLYLLSKLLHGIFSYVLVFIFYPVINIFTDFTLPASIIYEHTSPVMILFNNTIISIEIFIFGLLSLLCIGVLFAFCSLFLPNR